MSDNPESKEAPAPAPAPVPVPLPIDVPKESSRRGSRGGKGNLTDRSLTRTSSMPTVGKGEKTKDEKSTSVKKLPEKLIVIPKEQGLLMSKGSARGSSRRKGSVNRTMSEEKMSKKKLPKEDQKSGDDSEKGAGKKDGEKEAEKDSETKEDDKKESLENETEKIKGEGKEGEKNEKDEKKKGEEKEDEKKEDVKKEDVKKEDEKKKDKKKDEKKVDDSVKVPETARGKATAETILQAIEKDQPEIKSIEIEEIEKRMEKKEKEKELTQQKVAAKFQGKLTLTVVKATDLSAADFTGKSDPYAKIQLSEDGQESIAKWKTKVIKQNLNPIWDQAFETEVNCSGPLRLEFVVYDWSPGQAPDFLGKYTYTFTTAEKFGEQIEMALEKRPGKKKDVVKGTITFVLNYKSNVEVEKETSPPPMTLRESERKKGFFSRVTGVVRKSATIDKNAKASDKKSDKKSLSLAKKDDGQETDPEGDDDADDDPDVEKGDGGPGDASSKSQLSKSSKKKKGSVRKTKKEEVPPPPLSARRAAQNSVFVVPDGCNNYLSRLTWNLVFTRGVLSVTVIEGKFKKGKLLARKTQDLYITVNTGVNKSRSKVIPNTTSPKFNFSVDDVMTELGSEDSPVLIEVALWAQQKTGLGELQGLVLLPLVNFADKQDHDIWVSLKEQKGKDLTGWNIRIKVNFNCDVTTLKTEPEVQTMWENTLATMTPEMQEKMQKAVTIKDRWEALEALNGGETDATKETTSPPYFVSLLSRHSLSLSDTNSLLACVDSQKRSQLMWRSQFIGSNGVAWVFAHLKFLTAKIKNPIYGATDEDKQTFQNLLAVVHDLRAYKEKLAQYDHMKVLTAAIGEELVSQQETIQILQLLATLCIDSRAAPKIMEAVKYFMTVYANVFAGMINELKNGTLLQYKVAFMTLINATLLTSKDSKTRDILGDEYLSSGLTYVILSKLSMDSADDTLTKQIEYYFDQINLSADSKPKVTQLTEENAELKRRVQKDKATNQKIRKELRELKSQLKQAFEVTSKLDDLERSNKQMITQISNLEHQNEDFKDDNAQLREQLSLFGDFPDAKSALNELAASRIEIGKLRDEVYDLSIIKEERNTLKVRELALEEEKKKKKKKK